ncbi:MAG: phosphoribosylformylglycinamidine synthase subunit PurL [Candidatus Latescibacterota bacterium]
MIWKIEVRLKPELFDAAGEGIRLDAADLGLEKIDSVRVVEVYRIEGTLSEEDAASIGQELLTDGIAQNMVFGREDEDVFGEQSGDDAHVVEVAYNPGVMDPVEASVLRGIRDLGIEGVQSVRTAKKYVIRGEVTADEVKAVSDGLLANVVVQHVVLGAEHAPAAPGTRSSERVEVDLLDADDEALMRISREGVLSLTLQEMRKIQGYFREIGRKPTDVELEALAQTWSEHCVHKTFRGEIEYEGQVIDNLLKNTVMRVTKELDKPWCVSVFVDNAGVIEFDDRYHICFKVETHNHPSALEPYGGAGTGIGGVIRDPLGTGLGAKPILNTDVFCFGPLDLPREQLPQGMLHPKRIFKGVVAGVRDYGNRMGIPTTNGAICFDEGYVGNPLVYCGNVGIMPKDRCVENLQVGDAIVVVGGRTGRDGIHGATFSSDELSDQISGGVVQIGNPITEKKMTDVLLKARDLGWYSAITDCGAGGLSSAVGEMGEHHGAQVDLEKVPLKYEGLTHAEIWISEAQERMVLAVPPEHVQEILALFAGEDVEATVIGTFTDTGRLVLKYEGGTVGDLKMVFLHRGYPKLRRKAEWSLPIFAEPDGTGIGRSETPENLGGYLKKILGAPNVCSKEWVVRQYDHEVQGGSVLKPLVGAQNDGPGDASVTRPLFDSKKGIILSNGINPQYGKIDPYWMAASAIDESLRQIIAVGGSLERTALLDNFCWGNPAKPDRLGGLVRAATACYDIAKAYGTPFISGKDSFNNEYLVEGESRTIPPTLLISAISVMEDVERTVSMDLKAAGNGVYVVGKTYRELGGSHYFLVQGYIGNDIPKVRPETGKQVFDAISAATSKGLIRACHDCSEGGIGVAAAEMAFAGEFGIEMDLTAVPRSEDAGQDDVLLFSESNSRFVVEVAPSDQEAFERVLSGVDFACVGKVVEAQTFLVRGLDGAITIDEDLCELKESWQAPLRDV